jgi:alpha-tubulin suppressor-like RCC1 family protein
VCGWSLGLTKDRFAGGGVVYTWGWGADGRLGHGNTANVLSPRRVSLLPRVVSIAAGFDHAIAMTGMCACVCVYICVTAASADGSVHAWGKGSFGCLGVGDETAHPSPVRVESLCGRGVRHVYAGDGISGALLGAWCVGVWLCHS